MKFHQGDLIKITGYAHIFLIVSNNAFLRAAGVFHVCPVLENLTAGPLHIPVESRQGLRGIVVCEQIKLIDPQVRNCRKTDDISYGQIMNISDALQGIFEYD